MCPGGTTPEGPKGSPGPREPGTPAGPRDPGAQPTARTPGPPGAQPDSKDPARQPGPREHLGRLRPGSGGVFFDRHRFSIISRGGRCGVVDLLREIRPTIDHKPTGKFGRKQIRNRNRPMSSRREALAQNRPTRKSDEHRPQKPKTVYFGPESTDPKISPTTVEFF